MSPNPPPFTEDRGCLYNQKEWATPKGTSEEWKMNAKGMTDWKRRTFTDGFDVRKGSIKSEQNWDTLSQSSIGSHLKVKARLTTPHVKLGPASRQDVMCGSPQQNPFLMADRHKEREMASSIQMKALRGVDKIPDQHFTSTHQVVNKAKNGTDHLLPTMQHRTL